VGASTTLTYTVIAMDRAGNKSAASNAVTLTTPPCPGFSNEQIAGDFDGELEVTIEDYPGGRSRTLYSLQTARERLSLRFPGNPPENILTGAHVRVKGVLANGAVTLVSSDTGIETLAFDSSSTSTSTATTSTSAVVPNTFGAQKTLVMLVNFQNDPTTRPWTFDEVRSAFSTVSDFFWENSYKQTWLSTDVYGWYILPLDNTTCNLGSIGSNAKSAATAAGVNLSAYTRYVYVFPWANCGFNGASTVGGNPSQEWINGDLSLGTVAHEMGHGLGLYHSHSLVCNNTGDASGTIGGPYCFVLEYGDGLDIMGWSSHFQFNAFAKEILGWLNNGVSPPISTVQASGTYVLDPYELTGSKPKALKILKSINLTTGLKTWYYVEYRQATGFDSYLATIDPIIMNSSNILNGVLIRTGSEEGKNTSDLLDMTPETYHLYTRDSALDVGKSFSDPMAGVTITPQWVDSVSAGVSVSFSQTGCVHANPAVALSPSSQAAQAGASVTYSVSVTNNDNAGCSASTLNLQAIVPAGWTAAFSASALTLSPGQSVSSTLTVTSPVTATVNLYSIGTTANVTNWNSSATATATYNVSPTVSTLVTTVSTDKLVYSAGEVVTNTDTTTIGGQAVANAIVTFTITKPNGVLVTQSATTDTNGQATYKLRLNKQKDPKGTYQVRTVSTSNAASANATTSFSVQ
jgi:hypothetical protein